MAEVIKTHVIEDDGIEYWMAELDEHSSYNYSVGVRDTEAEENLPVYKMFHTKGAAEDYFNYLVERG